MNISARNVCTGVFIITASAVVTSVTFFDFFSILVLPDLFMSLRYGCNDATNATIVHVKHVDAFRCDVDVIARQGWNATVHGVECSLLKRRASNDVVVNFNHDDPRVCSELVTSSSDVLRTDYKTKLFQFRFLIACWIVTAIGVVTILVGSYVTDALDKRARGEKPDDGL